MKEDGQALSAASRARLLAGIRRRRPEFEAAGERAEKLRALPGETVATLRGMGAFWLKTPAELGGTPLAPLDFCDVMEEFGYADAATAWTVMVGNGGTGTAGGWLPDAGAGPVFAPGGYVVSGRWGFASGVSYADWLLGGFRVPGDDGLPDRLLVAVVPKDDVEVVDNWHVAGLQGSGSFDFRMSDVNAAGGDDLRAGRERLPGRRAVPPGGARLPVQRGAAAVRRHRAPRARPDR